MIRKLIRIHLLLIILTAIKNGGVYGQHLKGRVINEAGKPLTGASISLTGPKGSKIVETVSDSSGHFGFSQNLPSHYLLVISHTGYIAYKAELPGPSRDIGEIRLLVNNATLEEAVVTSNNKIYETDGGNIIYNISRSINAQGTDALEVLKKAPGVSVENETIISLNGKQGALVLLDGKQTYLSGKELIELLKSMPSSGIRSIELIHTPTAKYDAVGSAGIINIRTIKSPLKGFSGSTTTGIARGIKVRQNQDISFNYRKKDYNIYGSYNHFIGNYKYVYATDRSQDNKVFESFTDDTDKRNKMGARLGADYTIDKKNTVGILLTGNFVFGGGLTNTHTGISTPGSPGSKQTLTAVNDYYFQQTDRYNINLNYKYENEKGTIINIDADGGSYKKRNANLQSNSYRDQQQALISQNLYRSLNNIAIHLSAFKFDYTTTAWKGVLEAGAKYSGVRSDNGARFFHALGSGDSLDDRRSNAFTFNEQITSAYLNYKKTTGKWTFQGGIRTEHTSSNGLLSFKTGTSDTLQSTRRKYTNLFPSGSVTLKPNDKHSLSLSYARRLDRPAYQDLNPFIYLLDELSFWQGNPFLQPQYTGRTTLQYIYKSATILGLSFLHTDGYSARITDTFQTTKIVMIPRNLGRQQVISFSLTQNFSPFSWWEISLNGTVNHVHNKIAFDQYRNMNLKQGGARVNLQQRFKLPWALAAEVIGYFNSKRLTGANEIVKAMSQVDIGLQKIILKNKGTLRIAVADIYKGNRFNSVQQFDGFYAANYGYYETRQVRLNFTWKFADAGAKNPRTRNSALGDENGRIK